MSQGYSRNVVPRTGYVDRNMNNSRSYAASAMSYPARGTWIEIRAPGDISSAARVVPRTGYVDRNITSRDKI